MAFDTFYPNHPWAGISTNQRDWYVPFLREVYYRDTIYSKFVTTQFQLLGQGSPTTQKMTITSIIPPHGNSNPIDPRTLWMRSSYIDSFAREITLQTYGGKMALHEWDDLITYWQKDNVRGLKRIVNSGLGTMMTQVLDRLARNAFLQAPYALFGQSNSATANFSTIDSWANHKITTEHLDKIRLGMATRGVPFTVMPQGSFTGAGDIVCITSPGVILDLINEAGEAAGRFNRFIDVMEYADPTRIIRGEIGTYRKVRFIETERAILYNAGEIYHQATITESHTAGDGVPTSKVDKVRIMGQPSGVKNYIQVNDASGFSVGDIVTIHVSRSNEWGITNGLDLNDGYAYERKVVAVDTGANQINIDYPLMEDLTTNLGGGVYGYVTRARNIHTAIFLGGMDGVVAGVGKAPFIRTPPPVDDYESMYRISWKTHMGYQLFEPEVFEVLYLPASDREGSGFIR